MIPYTYTTVPEFLAGLETALAETLADQPDMAEYEDSIYSDLVDALHWEADPAIMPEVHRVTGTEPRYHP
jgi:hypothetical protein